MFQLLTSEAWTEIMIETMQAVHPYAVVPVAILYVVYHNFFCVVSKVTPPIGRHGCVSPRALVCVNKANHCLGCDNLEN
jgi:hypothetical protein